MRLILERTYFLAACTLGTLSDGDLTLHTLELPARDGLPGSAIPPGVYRIALLASPRFEAVRGDSWIESYAQTMPRLLAIPNRDGILIHWGNRPADTDGCILVGTTCEPDECFIGGSREAFTLLHERLLAAYASGESIQIEVTDEPAAAPMHVDNATSI